MLINLFKIKFTVLILIVGFIVTGCSYLVGTREIDISCHPEYCELVNTTHEFTQDVFLYKIQDFEPHLFPDDSIKVTGAIGLPRTISTLPYSVSEYERDPGNWQNTDTFATGECGELLSQGRDRVIGVVKAGTQFTIFKVNSVRYPSGNSSRQIYIQFLSGQFSSCRAAADILLEGNSLNPAWTRPCLR